MRLNWESELNLQPIQPALVNGGVQTLLARCVACGGHVRSDTGFADLDGEPFRAYYCAACGAAARRPELPPLPRAER